MESVRVQFGDGSLEYRRVLADPSGDDFYHFTDDSYYNNPTIFPNGATLQERFSRFNTALEINSLEAHNLIRQTRGGNSKIPDTEDLNLNSAIDSDNSYFEYEIPVSKTELDRLSLPNETDDFIVSKTQAEGSSTEWYLVRIPIRAFNRQIGAINDFTSIQHIRIWTSGHEVPITMRFATLELVGSQWRPSTQIGNIGNDDLGTRLSIATVNNEENPEYAIPTGAIRSQIRTQTGQLQNAREQSLVLSVEDLQPGDERAIFKTFNNLDLLKYQNLRMFVHGHGSDYESREDVRLFIRFGINETNDYYEYEQPVTPFNFNDLPPDEVARVPADSLWQTNVLTGEGLVDLNSVNVEFSALNQLKVARDNAVAAGSRTVRIDETFWDTETREFAPPGTRIGIRGNPSLSGITNVVIGIRNPAPGPRGYHRWWKKGAD